MLQSYLDENGISDEEFGALVGVTATSIYRYRKGLRKPDDEKMRMIFNVTGGLVDANGFHGLILNSKKHKRPMNGEPAPVNR